MQKPAHRQNSLLKRSKLTPRVVGATHGQAEKLLKDEEIIQQELSELLNTQAEKKERRRQISHRQWEENVYEPVSKQIRSTFDAEYGAHQARRDKAYDDYIEIVNKQVSYNSRNHVFLDIEMPKYDPFYVRNNSMQALVKTHNDPNKVQRRKKQSEFYIVCRDPIERQKRKEYEAALKLLNFPRQSHAKHSFWYELMLAEIDSEKRKKSQNRMNLERLKSQMADPIETRSETKRLFPVEQAKSYIKPMLDYYYPRHDIQV